MRASRCSDASTGEVIAQASSGGIDFAAVLAHARDVRRSGAARADAFTSAPRC